MSNNFYKKCNNQQIFKRISILGLIMFAFFLPIILNESGIINSNLDKFEGEEERKVLKSANGVSNLFEGKLDPLKITDFGNLYNNSQDISLNNQEEIELKYYLDDDHNWTVSRIESSVTDIQDTRNWINNSDLLSTTSFTIYQTIENPTKPYSLAEGWTGLQTLFHSGALAIRVHFGYIDVEEDEDYVLISNNNSETRFYDTGYKTDYFSPWIYGDELDFEIWSDGDVERGNGYSINYYQIYNESSNFYINNQDWGYINESYYRSEYGSGIVENNTAMYLEMFSTLWWDGVDFYSQYPKNNYTEMYQNLTIPRGNVIDGYIQFDYYPEFCMDSNSLYIYVAINSKKIYSIYFGDIFTSGLNQWHSTNKINMNLWVNNSNIFDGNINDDMINISIGLKSSSGSYYSGYENGFQQMIWFDNINLVLTTIANSTQDGINLTINGDPFNDIDWGRGNLNQIGVWDSYPVIRTVSTTSPDLRFTLDTKLYGYHNTTSKRNQQNNEGILYKILNDGAILWEFFHNFYMPPFYSDFEFIVHKPLNWEILSILDPTFISVPFE